jgi:hypothetical protein
VFAARRNYYFLAVLAQEAFFIMGIVVRAARGAHTRIGSEQQDNDSYIFTAGIQEEKCLATAAESAVGVCLCVRVGARTAFVHQLARTRPSNI